MTSPKTLVTLEFNKIIERVAVLAETPPGHQLVQTLLPSADYSEVLRRQRLTAEGRRFIEMKPNISLAAARDVRELVRQAALGHILDTAELLEVHVTLSLARSTSNTINRLRVHLPLLAAIADRIADFTDLTAEVNRCVNQRTEIVDSASPALAEVRHQARQAHDKLTAHLQRILNSSAGRQAAQEPIITLRDGRYVIPVKADMRSHVPGVVHDVSSSGATVFLEPLTTVELGNAWRELQLEEEREVQRILRDLSALVGEDCDYIVAAIDTLALIDLALAKARLAETMGCANLPYADHDQSWLVQRPEALRLVNARHPLLTGNVVPISLWVGSSGPGKSQGPDEAGTDGDYSAVLITGPNTGGKTVALKTAGLLVLMAQAGLAVPADEGSRIPVFDAVYADVGDEQSIEQSLSTFSSHMSNIIAVLRNVSDNSLVLLDELGAGTNPGEGAALAQAILHHLLDVGCLTLATTHHDSLKAFAHNTPKIMNACAEFDPETLAPTYKLSIGVPGRSNALAIAGRLGMVPNILDDARQTLSPDHLQVQSLVADLQRQRQAAEADRLAQASARDQAEALSQHLAEKVAALEAEREHLLERTSREMEEELAQARAQLREALREVERDERSSLEAAQQRLPVVEQRIERLGEQHRQKRKRQSEPLPAIQPGDQLWLHDLSQPGEAISAPIDGEVEVRLGALRAKVKLADVERVEKLSPTSPSSIVRPPATPAPQPEIAVRGMTVEEAFLVIDQYLDAAFLAGLSRVRIVHGKGTGTLRRAVRGTLSKHPLVKSLASAEQKDGGEGVTVVEMTSS